MKSSFRLVLLRRLKPMQRRLRAFNSSHPISSLRNFARKVCNDSTDPLGIQCSRRCGCPHLCISRLGPMVLIAGLWLCNTASCTTGSSDVLPAGAGHSVPAGQAQSSTTSHRGRVCRPASHDIPTSGRDEDCRRPCDHLPERHRVSDSNDANR